MSNVPIQGIEFEIKGNADSAVNSLERLANTLERLKGITQGGLGVRAFANELKSLKNALDNIGKVNIDKRFINSIASLSKAINRVDSEKITSLAGAMRSIARLSNNSDDLAAVVSYLQQIAAIDFSNLNSASLQLRSIAALTNNPQRDSNINGGRRESNTNQSIGLLGNIGSAFDNASSRFQKIASPFIDLANRAGDAVRRFGKNLISVQWNRATIGVKNLSDKLKTLANSFKRIMFYRVIRTIIKEIGEALKEGTENAYFYSKNIGDATKYISEAYDAFATASFTMKNQIGAAWATIFAMIQPILNQIIELIQRAAEVVTQFFAILSGKSTYLRALNYAQDWADEAENGAKAAKEWKNQLLGFDEINRLEEPSSGSGKSGKTPEDYAAMFEEVPVNEISDKFSSIFQVFKDAWASQGQPTINAIKGAIDSLKATFASVGDSFLQVFTNGAGQAVLEAYLRITQNVANAFKNLADRFREAWTANGTGTALVQASFGIWQTWLGFIERITGAFSDWASKLDFKPLLTSILGLRISFMELANTVLTWLGNAYENVLLPFGKWTIEEALPTGIELAANALDLLRAVCEKLNPLFSTLWNDLLKPFASWVGDTFTEAMKSLSDTLSSITDKIDSAKSFGEFIDSLNGKEKIIVALVGALGGLAIVAGISVLFSGLATVVGALFSPVTLAVGAFAMLIYAGIQLYQKFDSVKNAFDAVGEKFSEFKERCGSLEYWGELGTSIVEAIGTALGALVGSGLRWIVDLFKKPEEENTELESIGEDIGESVLQGIGNKFLNVAGWIYDHVVKPLYNGFIDAFDIDSSAKEMEPTGIYIGEGILGGIKDAFANIGNWIKTNVFDPFEKAVKTAFGIVGITAAATKSLGYAIMNGMLSGITNGWNTVTQWWDTNIASFFTLSYWQGLFDTAFGGLDILNLLKTPINNAIGGVETFINSIINGLNDLIAKFNNVANTVGRIFGASPVNWTIGSVTLPRLANGGIINGPTPILAGEAGKEAIIPLERNTGWISQVASEMNAQIGQENESDLAADLEDANGVVVNAIMAATSQIIRAMQENDGSGYDLDNFVRIVTQVQRKQARASGAY